MLRKKHMPRFGGRKGFALLVAVAVLTILTFTGTAVQRVAYEEMLDVSQSVGRSRARLAASAGLEAGLSQVQDFVAGDEDVRSIEGSTGGSRYVVEMRKATAGEVGPALSWLPAERSVIVLGIEGVYERSPDSGAENTGRAAAVTHRATAVVDPAKTPLHLLAWVNE